MSSVALALTLWVATLSGGHPNVIGIWITLNVRLCAIENQRTEAFVERGPSVVSVICKIRETKQKT